MPNADLARFGSRSWINPPGGGIGATITSSTTFTPTAPVHHIAGANTITTVVPPYVGFTGKITLIADAAFVLNTGGTAGSAIGAAVTATTGRTIDLVYDGSTWYASL